VEFEERNIVEDESALNELQELGVFSTPATVIDGELVIGFDKEKLEKILGLSNL
jgi:thioredoxin reductase (NADPH)